jgi:hypothetical protein
MDGEKRIILVGKMLKWQVGRAPLPKNLKMWSFTINKDKLKQWRNSRVTSDRESME